MLTEYGAKDNEKRLEDTNFRKAIKKIFRKLRIHANHTCHFGRVAAPLKLEFEELSTDLIRLLGKCLVCFFFFINCLSN